MLSAASMRAFSALLVGMALAACLLADNARADDGLSLPAAVSSDVVAETATATASEAGASVPEPLDNAVVDATAAVDAIVDEGIEAVSPVVSAATSAVTATTSAVTATTSAVTATTDSLIAPVTRASTVVAGAKRVSRTEKAAVAPKPLAPQLPGGAPKASSASARQPALPSVATVDVVERREPVVTRSKPRRVNPGAGGVHASRKTLPAKPKTRDSASPSSVAHDLQASPRRGFTISPAQPAVERATPPSHRQAPPLPPPSIPLGLGVAAGSAASGFGLALLSALLASFVLAAPRLGRWLRPAPDLARSPAYVSLLERPG
jgi:hypothetical protein